MRETQNDEQIHISELLLQQVQVVPPTDALNAPLHTRSILYRRFREPIGFTRMGAISNRELVYPIV